MPSPQLALAALFGATFDHPNIALASRMRKCRIGHMKHSLSAIIVICAMFIAAAPATAAMVSGTLTGGRGLHVVVVQSNGTSKKATITNTKGTFKVVGATLAGASIQLVGSNGTYFGPVLLGGSGNKVYETIKGSGNLALGTFKRKSGYGAARAPVGRYFTTVAYTVAAKDGKPIGAGKYGRVKVGNGTSTLKGYNGQGRDADLDGIPGAFDIDDNGNLIIDNVDRTTRSGRSLRRFSPALRAVCPTPDQPQPAGCTPPGGAPSGGTPAAAAATEFKLFSNYKLTDATSINVSIPGITGIVALIDAAVPTTVTLATQVMGATSSTLDCLGNTYCAPHGAYPLVNSVAASYTGAFLNLSKGTTGDAQILPGAARTAIGSGNAFLQIDGTTSYPGVLNFVFNTAPALKSFNAGWVFDQDMAYDASGVSTHGGVTASGMTPSTPITTGSFGGTSIMVTFWRPQRAALPSEAWFGSANPWTDIGGLAYRADTPNAPTGSTKRSCAGGYSAGSANGVAVTAGTDGIVDPALDAEASAANTISWTIDLATCFDWSLMASGTTFDLDIQAFSMYGDNAARKLYFRKL